MHLDIQKISIRSRQHKSKRKQLGNETVKTNERSTTTHTQE